MHTEGERLAALAEYQLLDTPNEEIFDAFTRLAAQICGVPISLLSLIDADRQFHKSNTGLAGLGDLPRDVAFCSHTILDDIILEVPDALADERFAENPLVTGVPNLRFYAGVPLITSSGAALGALCVLDRIPRELTMDQRAALRTIADAILEQFEARRALLRLFDSSQIELFHVDIEARCIVFASEAARRNLGYDTVEMRSIPVATILPQLQDADLFAKRIRDLRGSPEGRLTITSIAQRKDTTTYPIELRIELMRTPRGEIALAFGTDLTAELATQERLALLTTAIEQASEAIAIVKPESDGSELFVYANAAYLEQKRTTIEALVGKPSDFFDGPRTDRQTLAAFNAQLLRGETGQCEYVTYRADGTAYNAAITARPIAATSGRVTHVVIVQRDITDRVRRDALMIEQNMRLTALTESARELFSSLDARLLVESVGSGIRDLVGAQTRVLVPHPDGGFVPSLDLAVDPDRRERGDGTIVAAGASGTIGYAEGDRRIAIPVRARTGTTAFVLDIRSEAGPLTTADVFTLELFAQYFGVAARNVELYTELASRRSSVVELNQIKNDLIAMLAHDFKGPLTTIVGFADVLAEEAAPESDTLHYLQLISSSALRLASLATDTLALSRLEENALVLEIEEIDFSYLVRDVARSFAHLRPVDILTTGETIRGSGDPARLRQVFENLIGNAIKYSPGGQHVEITMRTLADGVEISITDRGIGIPDIDRARLFGRFARASNARRLGIGGTGFGLYLCRTIVDLHGGRIEVDTKEAEGSTFRVVLPTATGTSRPRTRRVLVQDRDGETRSYIGHALRAVGYAVTIVEKTQDLARALAQTTSDVVIVDIDRLEVEPEAFLAALDPRVRQETGWIWLGPTPGGVAPNASWDASVNKPFLTKDLQYAVETAANRAAGRSATINQRAAVLLPPE